jgi:hypothetical protein
MRDNLLITVGNNTFDYDNQETRDFEVEKT